MWRAPDGFFETVIALAAIGIAASFLFVCWLVYFLATNLTIGWG